MIFNKIFHFVKGYVIIEITGVYIERFLYICAKRGIRLFGIGKKTDNGVLVCIGISDYHRVRSVCFKTGTRVRILKKCGLPFLYKKVSKRYFLLTGLFLAVVFIFLSSQFIWSIEIMGTNKKTVDEISLALEKTGLHIGSFKPSLIKGEQMKSIILNNTDNLVWAWVYVKGTKACVDYREGIKAPPVTDKSLPCDIVALKDGVITKIVEKNGEKRVSTGEAVLSGDLLIAGTLTTPDETLKTVHALGEVRALTHYEKSASYKLFFNKPIATGRIRKFKTVKLFSKCFDLFFSDKPGFDDFLVREKLYELKTGKDNYLGIGIYEKNYHEIAWVKTPLSYDFAVEMGRNELEEQIAKELLPGSRLISKTVRHEKTDDETVKVTVQMEFEEKIAQEKEIIIN